MLDLDASRAPVVPRPAATVVLVRDGLGGLEVFCVERSRRSTFLAGALVFPGGAVDPIDRTWAARAPRLEGRARGFDRPEVSAEAFAFAALRETLEEAGILLAIGDARAVDARAVAAMRHALLSGTSLPALLDTTKLTPTIKNLVPLSRWITPVAEKKRFDTAFFLAAAPPGQAGAHDDGETVSSVWATPAELLARWEAGIVSMVPPTHATLEWLGSQDSVSTALTAAERLSLSPICPELGVDGGSPALLLPGDPEHSLRERERDHVHAPRYVLCGERFVPRR